LKAPERIETARLILRKPVLGDAASIFSRYASDRDVTKYLAWSRHQSLADTESFVAFSDSEWHRWPAGPYLIESHTGQLLGSTGLAFESPKTASTGYVLAKDAWGKGYATEALHAMVTLASSLHLENLYALCHPENSASIRVLEKCGFLRVDQQSAALPAVGELVDCWRYERPI
jgi:[ribosomal protein S5]-alanine N-acetyltransferase